MTTHAAAAQPAAAAPPPFAPQIVEEVLRNLARSVKTRMLYLPNNPVYKGTLDTLRVSFENLWKATAELTLTITETEFHWGDVVVGREETKSDSLAWLFYKDGIRELTLHTGFESEELVAMLDLLQRVKKASPEEDDLLTLMWEQDFLYLRYRFVDVAFEYEEIEPSEEAGEERTIPPEQLQEPDEQRHQIVRMEDFDSTLYFLDESEIEYIRTAFQAEYRSDLRRNVVAILLDVFELQAEESVRSEIVDILDNILLQLVSAREFGAVAFLLREGRVAAERAVDMAEAHRERLQRLPDRLSVPDVLAHLLHMLDEAPEVPPQEDLDALFEQLRPATLTLVFSWLSRIRNATLRSALDHAATRLAAANTTELLKLILSTESAVAQQAIRRAGELKTPAAVTPLGRILTIPSPVLRLVAVQALAEIGSPGALRLVEQAIADSDRDVRVAAIRAIGARRHHAALPKLEGMVQGKAVREADLTEKMAVFEVYGQLAGRNGVGYLTDLLNSKKLFGRREDAEIRACAAMALGKIGNEDALTALREAAADKELLVRNAANRALRGPAS